MTRKDPDLQPSANQDGEWTISQVAERTGVPIATIKFYIRRGLLPRPRTAGRTVGRYDATFVRRLEAIRELRRRHVPVREIPGMLAIDPTHALPQVPAAALQRRSGLAEADLAALGRLGLLTPLHSEAGVVYSEGDARIAEAVGALRRAGYDERLGFTTAALAKYVEAMRALVVREVQHFDRPEVRALPRDEVLRLIEEGVAHIDVLLGLLHKKLLLSAVTDSK